MLSSGATTLKKVRRWFPGCFFLRCHRNPLWCYFLRHITDLSAFLLAPSIFVSKTRVAQRCAARVRCCRAPPTQPPNDDVLLLSSSFSFSAETSTDSFARFLSAWCILATNYGDGDFFGTSDFCWWADTKIASSSKGIFLTRVTDAMQSRVLFNLMTFVYLVGLGRTFHLPFLGKHSLQVKSHFNSDKLVPSRLKAIRRAQEQLLSNP